MVSNCDRGRARIFLGLVLSVVAAGCGPGWTVIRDGGSPSPLRGAGPITVSFDYSKLMVEGRTERDHLAAKTAEKIDYPTSWAELKKQLETNFVIGMGQEYPPGVGLGPAGPTGVHVVVYPTNFTIGHYIVIASTNTELQTDVVFYANGQQADVIGVTSRVAATVYRPTVFAHMPPIATDLGRLSGKYVQSKNK